MEKCVNWKEQGMWVVRDTDGLYICNRKPYKNFHDEHDFVWSCEGDFIKLVSNNFNDLKFDDEPVQVDIIHYWKCKDIKK